MLVLTNFVDIDQFDIEINRYGTNKPELRQKNIYNKLLENKDKYQVLNPYIVLTKDELINLNIHDNDYIDFLEGAYSSFTQNPDNDYLKSDGIIPYHLSKNKFYQSYKNLPLWRQLGHFCDDVITPINNDTYKVSIESANNCFVAVDLIELNDKIYCLNTYPGHHARRDGCSGHCYINNAYVCVSRLISKGKRGCSYRSGLPCWYT